MTRFCPDYGFFLTIPRVYVKDIGQFQAADPWNGDRIGDFVLEDYYMAAAAYCSMPAIWCDAGDVVRLLPDSLCDLYLAGTVPATALPHLLKTIEPDLVRSDFLPVVRNWGFRVTYRLYTFVCVLVSLFTFLTLFFMMKAPPTIAVPVMAAVLGSCWAWLHLGYRRKVIRRKGQKAFLLEAHRLMGSAASTPAATVPVQSRTEADAALPASLLTLDEIEAVVRETADRAGVSPDLLPTYGWSRDLAYPSIEVDEAYHIVTIERGQEIARQTTRSLDDLQYRIFEPIYSTLCSREAASRQTPWLDSRRTWFVDVAQRLGRINPAWRERCEADYREVLLRRPFRDLLSLTALKASIDEMLATLDIAVEAQDLPTFGKQTFDGWYVDVRHTYEVFKQERGSKYDAVSTRDLDDIQYLIISQILDFFGSRTRAQYAVAGTDSRRFWDRRQADLLRRVKPAWADRWSEEVRKRLLELPYADSLPD